MQACSKIMQRELSRKPINQGMRTILIVEDDESIALGLTVVFEMEKYKVVNSQDALCAIEWLKSHDAPDLILTDFRMGEHNGDELVEYVNNKGATIPLIMFTGSKPEAEKALAEKGIEGTFILNKPIALNSFVEWVASKINPNPEDSILIDS